MAFPAKGQLRERTFPGLALDIAAEKLNGLLRLSSGTTIKAVFFEGGRPVYAISSLPNEQFEHKLIKDRLATRGLIEAGKKRNDNVQCLGRTLVEIGVLKEKAMQDSARALAAEIIDSLFELKQGEYAFEEGVTSVHDAALSSDVAESVLERARSSVKLTVATPQIVTETIAEPVKSEESPLRSAEPRTARRPARSGDLALGSAVELGLGGEAIRRTGVGPASEPGPPREPGGLPSARPVAGRGLDNKAPGGAFQPAASLGLRQESSGAQGTLSAAEPAAVRDEANRSPGFQPAFQPGLSREPGGAQVARPAAEPGVRKEPTGKMGYQPAAGPGLRSEPSGAQGVRPAAGPGAWDQADGIAGVKPAAGPGLRREPSGGHGFRAAAGPGSPGEPEGSANVKPAAGPGLRREPSGGQGFQPAAGPGVRKEPTGNRVPPSAGFRPPTGPGLRKEPSASGGFRAPSGPGGPDSVAEHRRTSQQPPVTTRGPSVDWIMQEVTRKLNSLEGADHYDVLGVTKLASTSTINAAYEKLRDMFNSYRSSVPHHEELTPRLDALFARIKLAHETLSNIEKRRVYDVPPGKQPAEKLVVERGRSEVTRNPRPPREPSNPVPPVPKDTSATERPPRARAAAAGSTFPAPPPASEVKRLDSLEAERVAAQNFQQGKTYFDRRDLHTAVHMFREAVRLNERRGDYHFQLGLTLFILSQARSVHSHGEGCHVTCNLGGALSRNQRIRREAEQHLLKAAEMDPYNAEIRVRLGMLYKEAGMVKKAQQSFHEALLLDASNSVALSELDLNPEPEVEDDLPKSAKTPARRRTVRL